MVQSPQPTVIPAKAGNGSVPSLSPSACGVDSRFLGNDGGREEKADTNDTTSAPVDYLRIEPDRSNMHVLRHRRKEVESQKLRVES